jgi:nicotinate-nucleotide adenylyltransferase
VLYVMETQPIDELWIVPTYTHPFGKDLGSYEHRVAMCRLAAEALGPRVHVSRIEEELAQQPNFSSSRTYELVKYLTGQGLNIRLVVGADILRDTGRWYRWADIVKLAPLIVIGRTGHALPPGSVETLAMPEISSTEIRIAVASGDDRRIGRIVPRTVLAYITQHGLYKGRYE